ncbi:prepilin peptidase [Anaerolentibacter hominis]|uniref:prepilin peptidase n=1 Tax=Anaerolentibacter hominis TaxID=3079009 RepID=UPI0031B8916D
MERLFTAIAAALFGVCIGSFLNVYLFRVPKGENFVTGRSHCMSCGAPIKWYDLIPVLSYFMLHGKCRNCGSKLSPQYPLVEAMNGIAYAAIAVVYGFSLKTPLFCLAFSVLVLISAEDVRTFEIPESLNICLGILGLIAVIIGWPNWGSYLLGAVSVSGFFLLLLLFSKGKAMGGGDVKLMAAAGLLLGFPNVLFAAVAGCIIGSVVLLSMKHDQKFREKAAQDPDLPDGAVPFGPFLAGGIFMAMLCAEPFMNWYLGLFRA